MPFDGIKAAFSSAHMCIQCTPTVCDCKCQEINHPIPPLYVTINGTFDFDGGDAWTCCEPNTPGASPGNPFAEMVGTTHVLQPIYEDAGHNPTFDPQCVDLTGCDPTPRPFYIFGDPQPEDRPLYENCGSDISNCCGFTGQWVLGEIYDNPFEPGEVSVRGVALDSCFSDIGSGLTRAMRLLISVTCADAGEGGVVAIELACAEDAFFPPDVFESCGYGGETFALRCVRGVTLDKTLGNRRPHAIEYCQQHPFAGEIDVEYEIFTPCTGSGGTSGCDCINQNDPGGFGYPGLNEVEIHVSTTPP